ncbi:hypothetical protein C4552_03530 [Candidatus Parcubacteria bacterium]|nr:MAG: hypothetical protein C4552_03530 [Candidatus Parcubacteria bacterium]
MEERRIIPESWVARWAIGLAIAALALFPLAVVEGFQPYAGLSSVFLGIIAFVLGLIAVIRHKERNALVYFATAIGALALALLIGETFFFE